MRVVLEIARRHRADDARIERADVLEQALEHRRRARVATRAARQVRDLARDAHAEPRAHERQHGRATSARCEHRANASRDRRGAARATPTRDRAGARPCRRSGPARFTLSGWRRHSSSATCTPNDRPTTTTAAAPVARHTACASSANCGDAHRCGFARRRAARRGRGSPTRSTWRARRVVRVEVEPVVHRGHEAVHGHAAASRRRVPMTRYASGSPSELGRLPLAVYLIDERRADVEPTLPAESATRTASVCVPRGEARGQIDARGPRSGRRTGRRRSCRAATGRRRPRTPSRRSC